ncbi:unnamed protein product [Bubo scandiacus]
MRSLLFKNMPDHIRFLLVFTNATGCRLLREALVQLCSEQSNHKSVEVLVDILIRKKTTMGVTREEVNHHFPYYNFNGIKVFLYFEDALMKMA